MLLTSLALMPSQVGDLADDLDFAGVYVAVGLGDAVHVLQQEQALAVLHHALDLPADGAGVHVLLQDLAEGEDVALGLGLAEVAHEEPLHIVQLGLEDAAVGLHDRRAQHDHGGREVTGAGLPAAGAATVGHAPLLRAYLPWTGCCRPPWSQRRSP